jgi:septal ring factor EnvC (AmiA/AmiB activator)
MISRLSSSANGFALVLNNRKPTSLVSSKSLLTVPNASGCTFTDKLQATINSVRSELEMCQHQIETKDRQIDNLNHQLDVKDNQIKEREETVKMYVLQVQNLINKLDNMSDIQENYNRLHDAFSFIGQKLQPPHYEKPEPKKISDKIKGLLGGK